MTYHFRLIWALAALCPALAPVLAFQTQPRRPWASEGEPGYKLEITSFTATRAYAVGTESITLVGSVRNVGTGTLPAETVILRMYAVTGLDYLEGATVIRLPAMEPGSTGTYRWRVQPTAPEVPLAAALVLERNDHLPVIRLLPIQHFPNAPGAFGTPGPAKPAPAAQASGLSGWIDNGKVRLRIVPTASQVPTGFLWCRTKGGWRQTAVALPLAELRSGEPYQEPWWEVFRASQWSASVTPARAVLTGSGQVGVRWRATLDLTLNAGSSVVDVRLTASPRRNMQLYGIRPTRLYAGDGSFGSAASETLDGSAVTGGVVSAVRWGEITTGALWRTEAPGSGWTYALQPSPDGALFRLLGLEILGGASPATLSAASSFQLRWRLFAVTPSVSVREALSIPPPPAR